MFNLKFLLFSLISLFTLFSSPVSANEISYTTEEKLIMKRAYESVYPSVELPSRPDLNQYKVMIAEKTGVNPFSVRLVYYQNSTDYSKNSSFYTYMWGENRSDEHVDIYYWNDKDRRWEKSLRGSDGLRRSYDKIIYASDNYLKNMKAEELGKDFFSYQPFSVLTLQKQAGKEIKSLMEGSFPLLLKYGIGLLASLVVLSIIPKILGRFL